MLDRLSIKEHMDVVDAAGSHVGTVDEMDGDTIKLTRTDSADGHHHYLTLGSVERVDEGRVWLKDGASATPAGQWQDPAATRQFSDGQEFGDGQRRDESTAIPVQTGIGTSAGSSGTSASPPLFGTSGTGTGMGGSGAGEH